MIKTEEQWSNHVELWFWNLAIRVMSSSKPIQWTIRTFYKTIFKENWLLYACKLGFVAISGFLSGIVLFLLKANIK